MSLGESDAKFPNQSNSSSGQAPSPSRENPGAVYPKSSPTAAKPQEIPGSGGAPSHPRSVLSNPFEFQEELTRLEASLDALIDAMSQETTDDSTSINGATRGQVPSLREKFQNWKREITEIRCGEGSTVITRDIGTGNDASTTSATTHEGGLFTD